MPWMTFPFHDLVVINVKQHLHRRTSNFVEYLETLLCRLLEKVPAIEHRFFVRFVCSPIFRRKVADAINLRTSA
jgi:hypothetical protein